MKKQYRYKKYEKVISELESNGFSKLSEIKTFNAITECFEMWIGGGHAVLIEKFKDGYAAIYIDSENLPKIKKTKNGNTNN